MFNFNNIFDDMFEEMDQLARQMDEQMAQAFSFQMVIEQEKLPEPDLPAPDFPAQKPEQNLNGNFKKIPYEGPAD